MKTSIAGVNLIKEFEGIKLTAYKDSVGIPTIGIGTTLNVKMGMVITEAMAIDFLERDLAKFEKAINEAVKVQISQPMFDALSCWCYNVGPGAMAKSTLIKRLNAGDFKGAADQFLAWNRAGGKVLAGLTRRREAERKLFMMGI